MKNIFITLALLAATVAGAQTNSVKGSAEPSASALTGTENVLVIQGGATKLSSVAAINAAPLNAVAATNAVLSALITANAATITTASNVLQTQITANATTATTASNALQTLITANTARDTATTNGLQTQITANATTAAAANLATSNSILGIANAAAAQATATGVTNGGNANFGNLNFTPLIIGNVPATYFLNLSGASFQSITYTNTNGNSNLQLTNWAAGQSVTVFVKNQTGSPQTYGLPNYFQTNVFNLTASANTINSIPNGRVIVFNFVVLSPSQVYMSYANGY